jgi:predicted Zn-dependent protease
MIASMNRISVKAAVCFVVAVVAVLAAGAEPALAENQKISLIRDAEIENTIREFAIPVFRAADLDPSAISIHLVRDSSINAFVAGGQRLFLNTGLLTRTTDPNQIIGVIAHETGHIAGGHLARIHDALQNTAATTILALLLGGAAVGAGRGDLAAAIVSAGQSVGLRNLLQYSRTQESSADQAALKYLESAGISSKGLLEFMNILGDQELLLAERQDPYVLTHPLSRERVAAIADHVSRSPLADRPASKEFAAMHARMKAKLYAFLNPLSRTLRLYKETDNSLESRYARAIAYFRKPDMAKAIPLINGLIAEHPNDPYFWELKGQMYFETGDAKSALAPYQKAVELLPNNELIRTDLARVQLALNDPAMLDAAIDNLRYAIGRERDVAFRWHQLAIAYGRKGDKGHSSLALAEEALLLGRKPVARYHAGLAAQLFPRGSREWLQAEDILIAAKEEKKP